MKKVAVINVVGLTSRLIGDHTPFLKQWSDNKKVSNIKPPLPAVTTTSQYTYLTGKWPSEHGIVGNGWYFKEECEVKFWRQSNHLVHAPKIWEIAKELNPKFTCANMFWWYNMYSSADYSVTPRPNYLADGRKIPDCYSQPSDLRDELQKELGTFPLFNFWGPKTSIKSSKWIAEASKLVSQKYDPTLTLIYLPHLDYNIQRFGNDFSKIGTDLKEIDEVCKDLITFYESRETDVIVLSEYGITDVNHSISLNRALRKKRLVAIRKERGLELLDPGASKAFAIADHQIAHIYVNDPAKSNEVRQIIESVEGVDIVLNKEEQKQYHVNHERSGDFVAVADERSWFNYYYWLEDQKAPDFARMVDIHKKPGYDPVELFTDPDNPFVVPTILFKLLKKKLGFRTLMDVIPLKPELVKGSHGRISENKKDWPVLIKNASDDIATYPATEVKDLLLSALQLQ